MESKKNPLLSKTLWVNVLILIGALIPDLQAFLVETFGAEGAVAALGTALAVINGLLRFLTGKPLKGGTAT